MTNLATRNGSTAPVAQFIQRNTEETLAELHRPIDPRHFKTRKQGNTTLTYVPWATLVVGLLIYLATIPFVIHRSHISGDVMQSPIPAPILPEDGQD